MLLLGCFILASASVASSQIFDGTARICSDFGHVMRDNEDPAKCSDYQMFQTRAVGNSEPQTMLDLSVSDIWKIDNNALENVLHLQRLDVSHNQLTDTGILEHLPETLMSVDMSVNQIGEIQSGDFSHLINLHFIDLSYNRIRELSSGTFNGLLLLNYLYLNNNQISKIDLGFFAQMTYLGNLRLASNQISYVDEALCTYFKKLSHVNLDENEVFTENRCIPSNRASLNHGK